MPRHSEATMAPTLLSITLLLLALHSPLCPVYSQTLSASSVTFANNSLAIAATLVLPSSSSEAFSNFSIRDDPSDKLAPSLLPSAVLLHIPTSNISSYWAIRSGGSAAPYSAQSATYFENSLYFIASSLTPVVYKYDADGIRKWKVLLGGPGDSPKFIRAESEKDNLTSKRCGILHVAMRLSAASPLLPPGVSAPTGGPAVVSLDACSGKMQGRAIILSAKAQTPNVVSGEDVQDMKLGEHGIVYVATQLVRATKHGENTVSTASPVLHRVDVARNSVVSKVLPVVDCSGVRISVSNSTKTVTLAIDRHAALSGTDGYDAVEVYRLQADTLQYVQFDKDAAAKETPAPVDAPAPIVAKLPRRIASDWTHVLGIEHIEDANAHVLLLLTSEDAANVNNIGKLNTGKDNDKLVSEKMGTRRAAIVVLGHDGKQVTIVDDVRAAHAGKYVFPSSVLPAPPKDAPPGKLSLALDAPRRNAFIAGSAGPSLLLLEVKLNGIEKVKNDTDPVACIGASTRAWDERLITDIVKSRPLLRMQKHPLKWAGCIRRAVRLALMKNRRREVNRAGVFGSACFEEAKVDMLCWEDAGVSKAKLCATKGHVVRYHGRPMFMEEFCAHAGKGACVKRRDFPLNFKGECGDHVEITRELQVTQHIGETNVETAEEAEMRECELKKSYNALWRVLSI